MYKLTAFPKAVALRDGSSVSLRTLQPSDRDALLSFFKRFPEEERQFLEDAVTSPSVIERWTGDINYDRALPLVASEGDQIIADAVLMRSRHGVYRNVAGLRIVVDPKARQRGLGTAFMKELCDVAADAEVERVTAEFVVGVQDNAIAAAERLGFIKAATIHELLRDEHGRSHDVNVMVLRLGKWYEWWQF
jgi:L-amino acid N-acyltransferase YncA